MHGTAEPAVQKQFFLDAAPEGKSGKDFDQSYDQIQVKAHQDAVALFEWYAKAGDDAELKKWAARTLPHLKQHLTVAQKHHYSPVKIALCVDRCIVPASRIFCGAAWRGDPFQRAPYGLPLRAHRTVTRRCNGSRFLPLRHLNVHHQGTGGAVAAGVSSSRSLPDPAPTTPTAVDALGGTARGETADRGRRGTKTLHSNADHCRRGSGHHNQSLPVFLASRPGS